MHAGALANTVGRYPLACLQHRHAFATSRALNIRDDKDYGHVYVRIPGGKQVVTEWDCRTGARRRVAASSAGDNVEFRTSFAPLQERAFVLSADGGDEDRIAAPMIADRIFSISGPLDYTLDEPNACVLDIGRFSIDGADWSAPKEILAIDRQALSRPSEYGDFNTKNYLGGRDLVGEFVDACRAYGIMVGVYYSPPDWWFDRNFMSFAYGNAPRWTSTTALWISATSRRQRASHTLNRIVSLFTGRPRRY